MPACVTVKVRPATVIVPVRSEVPELAETPNETVPDPLPEVPPVTLIQPALLVAIQPQPSPALTATVPPPAAADTDWAVGEIPYEHVAPA